MKASGPLLIAAALFALGGEARAQTIARKALTLEGAKAVAAAAVAEARRGNEGGSIAVVDDGGHLMYLERVEPTFPLGAHISIEKARTAALFQRPSKVLEDAIVGGRSSLLAVVPAPCRGASRSPWTARSSARSA